MSSWICIYLYFYSFIFIYNRNSIPFFNSNITLHHIILICCLLTWIHMWHVPSASHLVIGWPRRLLFGGWSFHWASSGIDLCQMIIPAWVLCCRRGCGESLLYAAILSSLTVSCARFCSLSPEWLWSAGIVAQWSDTTHGIIDPHFIRLLALLYQLIDTQTVNIIAHIRWQISLGQ